MHSTIARDGIYIPVIAMNDSHSRNGSGTRPSPGSLLFCFALLIADFRIVRHGSTRCRPPRAARIHVAARRAQADAGLGGGVRMRRVRAGRRVRAECGRRRRPAVARADRRRRARTRPRLPRRKADTVKVFFVKTAYYLKGESTCSRRAMCERRLRSQCPSNGNDRPLCKRSARRMGCLLFSRVVGGIDVVDVPRSCGVQLKNSFFAGPCEMVHLGLHDTHASSG